MGLCLLATCLVPPLVQPKAELAVRIWLHELLNDDDVGAGRRLIAAAPGAVELYAQLIDKPSTRPSCTARVSRRFVS